MKNRFLKIKETKGSGIFTVLIAVLFLTAFGTLLLTLTYTSYSMKIAERQGKVVVYNASTAMDEIRVGVQSAVSDSIKKTYKDVMTDYNYYAGNIKDTFALKFSEEIEKYTYTPAGGEPKPLLNPSGNTYNLDVLEAYIKEDRGGVKSVTSDSYTLSNNLGAYTKDETTGVITLKGVHIEYSKGGRESSVTSDIVITPPDIGFYLTQYAITGIPEFTLISKGNIIHKDGITTQIEGSAYANSVVLNSGASSTLNIKKGSLICAGDIEANPGSNFNVAKNASVWAKNIVLDNSSNVSLLGSTYLADDLELNGTGSSATLGGSYFGFGTGIIDASNKVKDSAKSSAILVNGSNCTLDLSDLKDLIIAGFSFIGNEGRSYYSYAGITENDSNKDELRVRRNTMMGESIAVKGNQLAYIVPASAVNMVSWQVQEGINDVYETVFQKDDDGNLVYDDDGNPIVISQELISEGEDDFVRNDDGSPYNPTVKKVQGNPMIIKNSDFN
nr:hypothetical protein [Clostridia bacterium]